MSKIQKVNKTVILKFEDREINLPNEEMYIEQLKKYEI